ncbi:hypothetical protein DFH09DRAFT_1162721, partial [Mycena vulgaris]
MYNGKVKLVLVAGNGAPLRKSEPEYCTILSEATVYHFSGTNVALGTTDGFRVGSHDHLRRLLRCMLLFPSSQFTDAPHSPLPPRLRRASLRASPPSPRALPLRLSASPPPPSPTGSSPRPSPPSPSHSPSPSMPLRPPAPWVSFTDTHFDFRRIVPRFAWAADESSRVAVEL